MLIQNNKEDKYYPDCVSCGITIAIHNWRDKDCPFCLKGMPWGVKDELVYQES